MEKKAYFSLALIVLLPVLRSLEMVIYEMSLGMPLVFYWVPQVLFSLIIGGLLAFSAEWLDKNRARALWLLPLLTFVYASAIGLLNRALTHTLFRGGVAPALLLVAIDGLFWVLIAFMATFIALKIEARPRGLSA